MTNLKLRQAAATALNMQPVLRAWVGPQKLWALNGALMPPGTKCRYNSVADQTFSGTAMLAASVPTFWLGLNLMLIFAVILGLASELGVSLGL